MSFNRLTATLDYPMFIVTAASNEERSGCLVGFATQASIHPPRFLVGLSFGDHVGFLLEPVHAEAGGDQAEFTFHWARRIEPGHEA